MTEIMTVHEALCTLKMLDKRIPAAIAELNPVLCNKHINTKIDGKTIKEVEDRIKDEFQSVNDLIRRRHAIKRAVVKSNAVTEVVIEGETYTVAEAIEMKNHGIGFHQSLSDQILRSYNYAKLNADRNNGDALERRADENVRVTFGNTDMKGNEAAAQEVRRKFIEDQTVDIIDPIKVKDRVKEMTEFITSFQTKVDSALSVSNAVTQIEVTY